MRQLLHDEIDQHESLRDEAAACVETVKGQIGEIAAGCSDFKSILTEAAARLGNELADVTTKAVQIGLRHAKRRSERLNAKAEYRTRDH